ncbi:hypothetical protein ACFQGA_10355 [Marinobacter koreensis]|jgi:hypothetical protein|uniref:Nickel/cobalt transporter regulator n=1 Tax=Marinobacter koreensis TaxID=335974 RepID=A0ABW0RJN1_9GAMM|nr:hypothetical protein [Marinobacter koreensis]MCK7547336.1 hypothetical protein [Marinobacter koreensis]MDX1818437.1 hypothetical protein [Marinobacter sp.]
MKKNRTLFGVMAVMATLSFAPASGALAEEIKIPVGSQAARDQGQFPASGLTQASVRTKWGNPTEVRGPVGEPPITQWIYPDFIVYFEGNRVIHTVLKPEH